MSRKRYFGWSRRLAHKITHKARRKAAERLSRRGRPLPVALKGALR